MSDFPVRDELMAKLDARLRAYMEAQGWPTDDRSVVMLNSICTTLMALGWDKLRDTLPDAIRQQLEDTGTGQLRLAEAVTIYAQLTAEVYQDAEFKARLDAEILSPAGQAELRGKRAARSFAAALAQGEVQVVTVEVEKQPPPAEKPYPN